MKKLIFVSLFLALALGLMPAQAQDQKAELAQALRNDGSPLEAEVLLRFVELDMSTEWWAIMLDPGEERGARQSLRVLLSSLVSLANNMEWGDAERLNSDTGRKGNSPPLLAMLDGWKGRVSLKINMKFAPDATSKKETADGLDRMAYPISSVAEPRAGKLDLTLTFDPAVTEIKSSMSTDGSTFDLTLPAYTSWRQGAVDDILKRGN